MLVVFLVSLYVTYSLCISFTGHWLWYHLIIYPHQGFPDFWSLFLFHIVRQQARITASVLSIYLSPPIISTQFSSTQAGCSLQASPESLAYPQDNKQGIMHLVLPPLIQMLLSFLVFLFRIPSKKLEEVDLISPANPVSLLPINHPSQKVLSLFCIISTSFFSKCDLSFHLILCYHSKWNSV